LISLVVKPHICLIDNKTLSNEERALIKDCLVITEYNYINGRREIKKRVNLLRKEGENFLSFPTPYLTRLDERLSEIYDKRGEELEIEADFDEYFADVLDKHSFSDGKFEEPREWQEEALAKLDEIDEMLDLIIHRGLFCAMTGEGKSYLIARLVQKYSKTTLIVVPNTSVQNGLYKKLCQYFGPSMVSKSPPKSEGSGVTLKEAIEYKKNQSNKREEDFSSQSLSEQILAAKGMTLEFGKYRKTQDSDKGLIRGKKNASSYPAVSVVCFQSLPGLSYDYLQSVGCLIIDEAHWASCDTILEATREMSNAYYRFALSATPFKESKAQMELLCAAIGKSLIYEIKPQESMKRGTVQRPIYKQYETPGCIVGGKNYWLQDLRRDESGKRLSKYKEKDFNVIMSVGIIANEARNDFILDKCFELMAQGRRIFLAMTEEAHCFYFEKKLEEMNSPDFDYYVIHGGVSKKERRERELSASEGERPAIVVGTMAIGEGTDMQNITDVFLVDTRKSPIRMLQRIGRGLRVNEFCKRFLFQVHDMNDWFHDKLREHSYLRKKLFEEYYEKDKTVSYVEKAWQKIGGLR
jgi:superfamily II DNA or RNA helicase